MNSKNKNWLNFSSALLFFVVAGTTFAWNSVGPYTHRRITDDAINAISSTDYPDIHMFAEDLRTGSTTEAHNPPGDRVGENLANYDVWKPDYNCWWDKQERNVEGALIRYKNYDFSGAYLRIGYMLHLLSDGFVPAHQRFCAHGYLGYWTDDLEDYVDNSTDYGYASTSTAWTFVDKNNHTWHYWLDDTQDDDNEDNVADGVGGGGNIVDGPGDSATGNASSWGVGNINWATLGGDDDEGYTSRLQICYGTSGTQSGRIFRGWIDLNLRGNFEAYGPVKFDDYSRIRSEWLYSYWPLF